jgi:hypothetical protein
MVDDSLASVEDRRRIAKPVRFSRICNYSLPRAFCFEFGRVRDLLIFLMLSSSPSLLFFLVLAVFYRPVHSGSDS